MKTTTKTQTHNTHDKELFSATGVLLQFLASPEEVGDSICLIRGTMPPGVHVPLHSHAEPEILYVLDGTLEVYRADENKNDKEKGRDEWTTANAEDVITIPGQVRHALRNNSSLAPVTLLVATKPELYKFFREISKPLDATHDAVPPTPEAMQEVFRAVANYGYWMATREENAAIGLRIGQEALPQLPDEHRPQL